MPDQNATAGDNAGNHNSDTSTDNKNEGQQSASNTSNDNKQNEGSNGGKITFTPDQQAYINNLVKTEKEKEVGKAKTKWEADAKLSDDQRKDNELAEARAALRERDTRDAVIDLAGKAGVKNPKLFYNAYKADIETDEKTGKITNFKDVLATAKTDAPELFGAQSTGSADGGEGKTLNQARTMNDWMRGK